MISLRAPIVCARARVSLSECMRAYVRACVCAFDMILCMCVVFCCAKADFVVLHMNKEALAERIAKHSLPACPRMQPIFRTPHKWSFFISIQISTKIKSVKTISEPKDRKFGLYPVLSPERLARRAYHRGSVSYAAKRGSHEQSMPTERVCLRSQ